jgi:hypothetical protein
MRRVVAAMLLCLAAPAAAQQIPGLTDLPASAAALSPGLAARRAALLEERAALHEKIDGMNARCGAVEEGSAAEKACDIDQAALTNALNSHIQQSNNFNAAAEAAILAAKNPTPNPLDDTAVVDARNVPSGLPKFVDEAIASGYSGAPPGVGDRVRKGFQAVSAHDWKVARAWFQDALDHDPANAGLKRLAELADFTLERTSQNKVATSSASGALQLPESSDMQFLFPEEKRQSAQSSAALQLPKEADLEFLFPGLPALEAKELSEYTEKHWIDQIGTDPQLIHAGRSSSRKPIVPHARK